MDQQKSFLGTGWSFPPTFNNAKRSVLMTSDVEDINKSLEILFSTIKGERIMQPEYGSDLSKFLFEPLTTGMKTYMRDLINDAILYFEPRIKLIDLSLKTIDNEGRVDIILEYIIKGTNSRYNFVYPFYNTEGVKTT